MSSFAPDLDEAARFLGILDEARRFQTVALTGKDTGAQFGFATFDDNKVRKDGKLASRLFGDLDQAIILTGRAARQPCATIDLLTRMQARGAGVGVTVQQLDGKGATRENVTGIRAFFIDADSDEGLARLHHFVEVSGLVPSIMVESGSLTESGQSRLHAYWLVLDCQVAEFSELQEQLWARIGSDSAVNDLAHVMRLPGTWNLKGEPRPVRIVACAKKTYTCNQIRRAAEATPPIPGTNGTNNGAANGGKRAGLGPRPDHITDAEPNLNAAAHAGLHRFADLSTERQNAMLAAMLALEEIKALADAERNTWLRVLFALADAEQLGATDARPLALDWSMSSPRFRSETDFNRDWASCKPGRPRGITIGTLLRLAYDAGFDLGAWLNEEEEAEEHPAGKPPTPEQPGSQEPNARPVPVRYSDNALAYLFTDEHAEDLLYVHLWGTWLWWRSGRWRPDHTVKVYDAARVICVREGKNAIATMNHGRQIATQINKAGTVAAIERLVRHHHRHVREVEQFDADPMLLNTPTNTLVLNNPLDRERDHRRGDHLTRSTTVGAAATSNCPLWKKFLLRIMANDMGMVDYLQRVCGYLLTGSVEEHAMFFGYGTGANGKGTFANVLLGILNTEKHGYAAVAPISTFTAAKSDQHPTDLAMLQGVRRVIAQETEEGRSWAVAKLKMMTGGDRITARFMRQDFFTYEPQFKILVMGNHKPALGSVDEALRRRVNMIPFTEKIPLDARDPKLGNRLTAEYPEILRWMIEGCDSWQRIGLRPPPTVVAATNSYLADEDRVGNWIDECCMVGPTHYDTLVNLFSSWWRWANQTGEMPGSRKDLAKALDARPGLIRKKEAMTARAGWNGIAAKPDPNQAPGAKMAGRARP